MPHNLVNLITVERKDDIQDILVFSSVRKAHVQKSRWYKSPLTLSYQAAVWRHCYITFLHFQNQYTLNSIFSYRLMHFY